MARPWTGRLSIVAIPARRVSLPTYPFRRRRHWMDIVQPQTENAIVWPDLMNALDRQSLQAPLDLDAASYPKKWQALVARDHCASRSHSSAMPVCFWRPANGARAMRCSQAAKVGHSYRHLIGRWLNRLVAVGLLRAEGSHYVSDRPLPAPALAEAWRDADARLADNKPLLAYLKHCGRLVSDVLTGRESPLETLFPGGTFQLAEDLYQRSATMRYINELAAAAVQAVVAKCLWTRSCASLKSAREPEGPPPPCCRDHSLRPCPLCLHGCLGSVPGPGETKVRILSVHGIRSS